MSPKRSKRIAQKAGQANQPPAVALTLEEISVPIAQLLEGQRQTQQQIKALLAQKTSLQSIESQPKGIGRDRDPSRSHRRTQASPSRAEDVREVINNRSAVREERRD